MPSTRESAMDFLNTKKWWWWRVFTWNQSLQNLAGATRRVLDGMIHMIRLIRIRWMKSRRRMFRIWLRGFSLTTTIARMKKKPKMRTSNCLKGRYIATKSKIMITGILKRIRSKAVRPYPRKTNRYKVFVPKGFQIQNINPSASYKVVRQIQKF